MRRFSLRLRRRADRYAGRTGARPGGTHAEGYARAALPARPSLSPRPASRILREPPRACGAPSSRVPPGRAPARPFLLQLFQIALGNELEESRRAGGIQLDQIELVVVLVNAIRLLHGQVEQIAQHHLVAAAVSHDQDVPALVAMADAFHRGADTCGQHLERLATVERIRRIGAAPPPFGG